ncbi:MAG: hypothetical protein HRU75_01285 [Planctomycetia bacterium]|nr:MAG: hypothetical protein HRU75_01285 [Planctomycetia bacterium]
MASRAVCRVENAVIRWCFRAGVFGEADGPTPDAHFWQTIAQVRAYFGD